MSSPGHGVEAAGASSRPWPARCAPCARRRSSTRCGADRPSRRRRAARGGRRLARGDRDAVAGPEDQQPAGARTRSPAISTSPATTIDGALLVLGVDRQRARRPRASRRRTASRESVAHRRARAIGAAGDRRARSALVAHERQRLSLSWWAKAGAISSCVAGSATQHCRPCIGSPSRVHRARCARNARCRGPAVIQLTSPGRIAALTPRLSRCMISPSNRIGDGGEADMRDAAARRCPGRRELRRPEVIEEDERPDHAAR